MFQEYLNYLKEKLQDDAHKWVEEVSYTIEQFAEKYNVPVKDVHDDFLGLKEFLRGKDFPYYPNFFDELSLTEKTKLYLLFLYPIYESKIPIENINSAKIDLARIYQQRLRKLSPECTAIYIGGSLVDGRAHYWSDVDMLIKHNGNSEKVKEVSNNLSHQFPFVPWISIEKVIPPDSYQISLDQKKKIMKL
jgi:predicted nucleotidyltransferase